MLHATCCPRSPWSRMYPDTTSINPKTAGTLFSDLRVLLLPGIGAIDLLYLTAYSLVSWRTCKSLGCSRASHCGQPLKSHQGVINIGLGKVILNFR